MQAHVLRGLRCDVGGEGAQQLLGDAEFLCHDTEDGVTGGICDAAELHQAQQQQCFLAGGNFPVEVLADGGRHR